MKLIHEFYTPREVADLLRVDVQTIKKKLRDKDIKGIRINSRGDWRIPKSEVERMSK